MSKFIPYLKSPFKRVHNYTRSIGITSQKHNYFIKLFTAIRNGKNIYLTISIINLLEYINAIAFCGSSEDFCWSSKSNCTKSSHNKNWDKHHDNLPRIRMNNGFNSALIQKRKTVCKFKSVLNTLCLRWAFHSKKARVRAIRSFLSQSKKKHMFCMNILNSQLWCRKHKRCIQLQRLDANPLPWLKKIENYTKRTLISHW